MSVFVDTLSEMVQSSLESEATREDWQRAIDQVFGKPEPLDPFEDRPAERLVAWEIDAEGPNPAAAALDVWVRSFGYSHQRPGPDDPCVFIVTDRNTDRSVQIDLSDDQYAHLFHRTRTHAQGEHSDASTPSIVGR